MKQKFQAELIGRGPGGAWAFIAVPFDVEKVFGKKSRVPVTGTLNGFPFRNSLMPEGDGTHSMMVNKELQKGAKAEIGETMEIVMELDTAPRTVTVPDDLETAFSGDAKAKKAFAALSYSIQKEFIDWIVEAKKPETRNRRVEKTLEMLATGKRPKG
jgi:hypothetical protein